MISVLGAEKLSLVEIEAFLAASESVRFVGCGRTEIYGWVERLLCYHEYPLQKRRSKGLLRAYVEHMTGLSRAQSTRLIGDYVKAGRIAPKPSLRPRFQRHYTVAGVELLASVDEAHERLSGPATRHILKREFEIYGKPEFERLATLSNGHLYNLRQSRGYRLRVHHYERTRPTAVQIGERKKPAPNSQPGFLRIDTVHQGDSPEGKGIGSPFIAIDERKSGVLVVNRTDLAAIEQGYQLICHICFFTGRFFNESRTLLISGAFALPCEGVSTGESASTSIDISRLFSVRKMRPISAPGFPCSTSTSHFRLVPAFFAREI